MPKLIALAGSLDLPWLVTNDVHYATPKGRLVHDVLACLRHQTTLDEAGTLLRPNGEWYLKRPEKTALIDGMAKHGIEPDVARRIFNQISAFADYGFPESHAASFALLVYASAYLKHYYPVEFTCALLNAQPMGFYAPGTIVEDARRGRDAERLGLHGGAAGRRRPARRR